MAAINFTPISLYYTTTASAVPSAGNLVSGELALNITDEKLYFKNAAGTVKLLASNAATAAGVDSFSAGTTGFTPSTATTGAVTLAGTLGTANGGTNLTSFTSGGVVYASSSSALATGSGLQFDGSNLGINITPSAWSAQFKAIQFGNARYGTISQRNNSTSEFNIGWNVYNNSTGTSGSDGWVGLNTGDASSLYMLGGATHTWLVSNAAATAGSAVTWSSSLVFNSSGNLLVGGTAVRGTTAGTAHLDLFDGTAPAGTLTNGVSLYSSSGDLKFMDAAGNAYSVGYRNIPKSGATKTTSYTLATTDVGELIEVGSSGSIVVPDATFSTGDAVVIFNNTSGAITLTMSITTAYIGGTDADKATISLATRGICNILFISGTVCVVTGNVT